MHAGTNAMPNVLSDHRVSGSLDVTLHRMGDIPQTIPELSRLYTPIQTLPCHVNQSLYLGSNLPYRNGNGGISIIPIYPAPISMLMISPDFAFCWDTVYDFFINRSTYSSGKPL